MNLPKRKSKDSIPFKIIHNMAQCLDRLMTGRLGPLMFTVSAL